MGRVMQKGPGQHDMWFRVICIWNLRQNGGSLMVRTFKERFLQFQYYYFRTFITSIMLFGEWSGQKSLKLKMDKICRPGPFCMTRPKCNKGHCCIIIFMPMQFRITVKSQKPHCPKPRVTSPENVSNNCPDFYSNYYFSKMFWRS